MDEQKHNFRDFISVNVKSTGKLSFDILLVAISYYAAFLLRFDGHIPQNYKELFIKSMPIVLGVYLVFLVAFGTYRGLWRYASVKDFATIFIVNTVSFISLIVVLFEAGIAAIPRSVLFILWLLVLVSVGALRFSYRVYSIYFPLLFHKRKQVLVIGAGNAGEMLVRQALKEPGLGYKPVAIVDDNRNMIGKNIHGIPVMGTTVNMAQIIKTKHVEEIIIATPSATAQQMRKIIKRCEVTGLKFKTLPGPKELMGGQMILQKVRAVNLEDLLERALITSSDLEIFSQYYENKVVLVTGAAGSIGSELCRQFISHKPARLIMLDRAESDLFDLEHEILRNGASGSAMLECIICDITNETKLKSVFEALRPQIVFHAAAYKHVPFMQKFPEEAVINNVFGTIGVSQVARRYGVEKFVLVSSDKAVNPTNVMGATKRLTEMYCMKQNGHSETKHIVVRFGNVLGSKGSVVPLFKQQLDAGGPLLVTSKKISRYFMTIPEAVGLVLQAGLMGQGGELFILDMGQPVNIYDMATHMIKLSGLQVGKDIEIKVTGLRPGEKMFEELWNKEEKPIPTLHPKRDIVNSCGSKKRYPLQN